MFYRFSHYFAWLLLLLMPLQGIAAANMSVCNSMMQTEMHAHQSANKPCHMKNMHMVNMTKTQDACKHKTACKTSCATLCASLASLTAVTQTSHGMPEPSGLQVLIATNKIYTSHQPPNLQRPPISFI